MLSQRLKIMGYFWIDLVYLIQLCFYILLTPLHGRKINILLVKMILILSFQLIYFLVNDLDL